MASIGGAIDFYTRKTKDLLASVPTAAGTNFSKTILTNVGNVDSKGIEVSLNATPIQTKDWEVEPELQLHLAEHEGEEPLTLQRVEARPT